MKVKTSLSSHCQPERECFVETFTKNKTHKFNPAPYAVFISNLFGPGMSFVGGQWQMDLKSIILLFMGNNLMSPLHFNLRIICLVPGKFLLETSVRSFLSIFFYQTAQISFTHSLVLKHLKQRPLTQKGKTASA